MVRRVGVDGKRASSATPDGVSVGDMVAGRRRKRNDLCFIAERVLRSAESGAGCISYWIGVRADSCRSNPLSSGCPAPQLAQTPLHSRRPRRRKHQRAERQRTPCFKRRPQDYAEDRDWLVASRPLRRRLRRRCRCFFLLCHSKSLNGRSSIVER